MSKSPRYTGQREVVALVMVGMPIEPDLDLVSKRCHALAVLLDELFALSRRFAVLLNTVTKLEEAVVSR